MSIAEMNERLCCACLDAPKCVLLMPCNHVCLCPDCFHSIRRLNCPLCNQRVLRYVERVWL